MFKERLPNNDNDENTIGEIRFNLFATKIEILICFSVFESNKNCDDKFLFRSDNVSLLYYTNQQVFFLFTGKFIVNFWKQIRSVSMNFYLFLF